MKQTAVEWLVEKICTDVEMYDEDGNMDHVEFWNAFRSGTDLSKYINQAKEMEKEQIIDAWFDGGRNWESEKQVDDYIDETFKSE